MIQMWPDQNSTTNLAIKMYNYFFSSRNNLLKLSDKIFKMDFFFYCYYDTTIAIIMFEGFLHVLMEGANQFLCNCILAK